VDADRERMERGLVDRRTCIGGDQGPHYSEHEQPDRHDPKQPDRRGTPQGAKKGLET
jgi:hypothetical protein